MWWNKTVSDVIEDMQESLEDLGKIAAHQQIKIDDYDDVISIALARQKSAEMERARADRLATKFRKLLDE